MANVNRTNQNRDVVVAAIEFAPMASGGFTTSGNVALVSISGSLNVKGLSGYLNLGEQLSRPSYQFTSTVVAPVNSGTAALWQNSGNVQIRTPQAADIVVGTQTLSMAWGLSAMASGNSIRMQPGFACTVQAADFVVGAAPGQSGNAIIQMGIQGASMSGGQISLVWNNMSGGARIAGTAITANAFNAVGTSGEITATVISALSGSFGAGPFGTLLLKLGPPA